MKKKALKKNNKKRNLIGLLALFVAAVLIFAVYYYAFYLPQKALEQSDNTIELLSYDSTDVTDMSSYANGGWTLILKDGHWQSEADDKFPLNTQYAESLVNYLSPLSAVLKVAEGVDDLSLYGLSAPQNTVRFKAKGTEHEIKFGDTSTLTGRTYMMLSGDEALYMVDTQMVVDFETSLYDMILLEEWPITSPSQINSVTWEHAQDDTQMVNDLTLSATRYDDSDVPIEYLITTFDGEEYVPNSDDAVVIYSTFSSLYVASCVSYNASEEELIYYGLKEPQSKITIESTDGDNSAITTVLYVGTTNTDGQYYVRINDSTAVNTMDGMILSGAINPTLNAQ